MGFEWGSRSRIDKENERKRTVKFYFVGKWKYRDVTAALTVLTC